MGTPAEPAGQGAAVLVWQPAPADVRAKFYTITAGTADQVRERTRLWTTVKTGR